jgi:type III pantothenate kinase
MILCIDCGNSRIKAAIGQPGTWRGTAAVAGEDFVGLATQIGAWPRPIRVIGCNVAGAEVGREVVLLLERMNLGIHWIQATREGHGVRNAYDHPGQLGADRWAALIGARALHAGASLVVSCGTATTIDVLDAAGCFQGGLILPGLALMHASLASAAAQLPQARGRHALLPRNTDDAIVSGAIEATAGAVSRMFGRLADEPDALCLLSGGAADELAPHLALPLRRVDNLVLEGLVRIAGD